MRGTLSNGSLSLPIVVEVTRPVQAGLRKRKGTASFASELATDVSALLKYLGLPGEPHVELQTAGPRRSIRIWVHGVLQPFDQALALRAWQAAVPSDLRYLPHSSAGDEVSKAGWSFDDYVQSLSDQSDWRVVSNYLRRLVLEVVRTRAGCLVGLAQASAYRDQASGGVAKLPAVSSESVLVILQSLLNLGVTVDKPEVGQAISSEHERGNAVEAIAEALFSRLRSDRIEVHVNREYLKESLRKTSQSQDSENRPEGWAARIRNFLGFLQRPDLIEADERFGGPLSSLEEQFHSEFGVQIPKAKWIDSSEVADQLFAFKINDMLTPPFVGLKPNEILAHCPVAELAPLGIEAIRTMNSPDGKECAVIAATAKDVVNQNEIKTWDAFDFIAQALYAELSRLAPRLLSSDVLEFQLARLEKESPALVREIVARYSLADLTRTTRDLVAEGISVGNPRAILERLLQFETIPADDNLYRVFDDRLPVGNTAEKPSPGVAEYREFVRSGLKNQITYKYAENEGSVSAIEVRLESSMPAHSLSPDVPRDATSELADTTREELIDKIRETLAAKVASPRTVLLTTSMLRPIVKEIVAGELPDLPVLADRELSPGIDVIPIATVFFSRKPGRSLTAAMTDA